MPPARLFISHSVLQDPAARSLVESLCRDLEGKDLEILVDWKGIESGDDWHDTLIDWMMECHGAILLLSERALLRDWVIREATILDLRQREDPDFELIPVFLAGIDPAVLRDREKTPLAILGLDRLQGEDAADEARLLAALKKRCERLRSQAEITPARRLLRDIAAILGRGHPFGLEHLAEDLDARVKQWLWNRQRNHLTLALALRMAALDLPRVVRALEGVSSHYELRQAQGILDHLAPLRVHPAGASAVARVVGTGRPGLRLNAEKALTAKLYARRAFGEMLARRFVQVTNSDAGCSPKRLQDEIIDALLEFTGADCLDEAQRELADLGRPLFVLLPGCRPDAATLQRVSHLFPTVTFCWLTGRTELPAAFADPAVEPIHPSLGPEEEEALTRPYSSARRRLEEVWRDDAL